MQLDDRLLALLDERAERSGSSRSALVRNAIETYLAADADAALDAAIVAGYEAIPPGPVGASTLALAIASIEDEPW